MVKKVAVIALDPRASAFYGKQVQELFGEYVKVNSYSVREGTISNMERADLYLMSTDAFDNREDVPQYIPIEAQISEIHVTYLWETIRLLRTCRNQGTVCEYDGENGPGSHIGFEPAGGEPH